MSKKVIGSRAFSVPVIKIALLCSLTALAAPAFTASVIAYQIVNRQGTIWIGLSSGKTFRIKGYELTEEVDSTIPIRKSYIKRPTDKQPIHFYTHSRAIVVTIGNHGQLLLINDQQTTKSSKVVVVNLNTHKASQIDVPATEMYRQQVSPDKRLIIVPEALAFSPDDKQVLIEMKLIHIGAGTKDEAESALKTYSGRRYVVDSSNGKVLQEYRTNRSPKIWWMN
jgi:hypothetical protein